MTDQLIAWHALTDLDEPVDERLRCKCTYKHGGAPTCLRRATEEDGLCDSCRESTRDADG